MDPRGRGRARRGRGQEGGGQRGPPAPGGGSGQQRPAWGGQQQGPPPGAWGGSGQQRGPPQGAWGGQAGGQQPQRGLGDQRPQASHHSKSSGRGIRQGDEPSRDSKHEQPRVPVGPGGEGGAAPQVERGGNGGSVRGRINRNEIIHTKPAALTVKQGTTGTAINLKANFFKIISHPNWCLHQYRVDFQPDVDETKVRRKLIYIALKEKNIGGYLFDGTCLYTPIMFKESMIVAAQDHNDQTITMTIRMVSNLQWGDYHYISVFNLIVRKCLYLLNLQLMGRDYYDPHAKINIPEHQMELWPGYYTSIRQHENSILMCSELTFKMLRTDTVYDLLINCRKLKTSAINQKKEFQSSVIGCIVLTGYNNKTYHIDDIDFDVTPNHDFTKKDGSKITYVEYFKQKYNLRIQDPTQPMLVSMSKPREIRAGMPEMVLLVPELCQLTGLSDQQRSNFQLMSALATHTRVGPQKRMDQLVAFAKKLNNNQEIMSMIRGWDLKIADSLVQLTGRVLPMENISAGQQVKYSAGTKADWTRDLRSNQMLAQYEMVSMPVLVPGGCEHDAAEFLRALSNAARGMHWDLNRTRIYALPDDRTGNYLNMIDEVCGSNPSLIMCAVKSKAADRYNSIKKKCCVDMGIPSQVVLAKQFRSKGVMSIATKIAIQLNCKIGGAPWCVSIPLKTIMVVGYDVCRDTINKKKSFGGMVASLDSSCTRFYNSVSEHEFEEELSNNFAAFLVLSCQQFKKKNGNFPVQILIYRDGVGEGQLSYVFEHEVQKIKAKLEQDIYTSNNLKMAFVIVSKRIKTRIFAERGQNPPPGTIVDDVITQPERYDFFCVSQCVNQGTVSPTSYNVIYDTMGLPPDRMQILTHKLTHMYYNWSGTVRVPAPCQYAHKLAFLVAQSLHRAAHRRLETLLYFL